MQSMTELVRLAQRGDSTALGALYEVLAQDVFRFVRSRIVGPAELIEDLTAEIFMELVQHLHRYQERATPFQAWLFRIARNHLIDYWRTSRRYPTCPVDEQPHLATSRTGRILDQVLDRQILVAALVHITDVQQQVIQCRFFDELSVAETAVRLGRSEAAVKKIQARGLVALQKLLSGQPRTHLPTDASLPTQSRLTTSVPATQSRAPRAIAAAPAMRTTMSRARPCSETAAPKGAAL